MLRNARIRTRHRLRLDWKACGSNSVTDNVPAMRAAGSAYYSVMSGVPILLLHACFSSCSLLEILNSGEESRAPPHRFLSTARGRQLLFMSLHLSIVCVFFSAITVKEEKMYINVVFERVYSSIVNRFSTFSTLRSSCYC